MRNDDFDFREVTDDERVDIQDTPVDVVDNTTGDTVSDDTKGKESVSEQSSDKDNKPEFEDVCFVCRRPESKAGKMFHLPNNICVCDDCMHKTMDAVSQFDYQNMLNNPNLMNELNKNSGMPNMGFFNMGDFQNGGFNLGGGIPNSQKIKKKSEASSKPAIDIKNIPAPHKIKAKLDEYVIGQDQAKKVMSVAVYNH